MDRNSLNRESMVFPAFHLAVLDLDDRLKALEAAKPKVVPMGAENSKRIELINGALKYLSGKSFMRDEETLIRGLLIDEITRIRESKERPEGWLKYPENAPLNPDRYWVILKSHPDEIITDEFGTFYSRDWTNFRDVLYFKPMEKPELPEELR